MKGPSFIFAPAVTDLKDTFIAGGQQPFHAKFGRSMKKPAVCGDGIDMGFGGRGGNAQGGFDLKIPPCDKKLPDLLDNLGSCLERLMASGK
jgi:hypothetical protein